MAVPTVTVLLTVYNGERYLAEAIDSVLAQTFEDFELVVVDDGSDDGTPDVLGRFDDDRLEVFRQPNRGRSPALNRGLMHSRGEYVAVIDADDLAAPTRLETQVGVLDNEPQVDVLGSAFERRHEDGPVLAETVRPPQCDADLRRALPSYNPLVHSGVTYRMNAVEQVGGYDVGLSSCVDYDLWVRMAAAGFGFRVVDEPLCTIRKHDERAFDFDGRDRFRRWLTTFGIQWRAVDAVGGSRRDRMLVVARNTKSLGVDAFDELRR